MEINIGARRIFWAFILIAIIGGCTRTYLPPGYDPDSNSVAWIEEVRLQDGRTITMDREVIWTISAGGPLALPTSSPNIFSITFKNPDTNTLVRWRGKEGIAPITVGFVDRVPYLVVLPWSIHASLKDYKCPYPPYAFLRYDGGLKGWTVIGSTDLPMTLTRANVDFGYDQTYRGASTAGRTEFRNTQRELETGFWFQVEFPRDIASWRYNEKHGIRYNRYEC